jgi:hypothetical protein
MMKPFRIKSLFHKQKTVNLKLKPVAGKPCPYCQEDAVFDNFCETCLKQINPNICKCINVEFGSYDNQVEIKDLPPHMAIHKSKQGGAPSICLDACVADEIQYLWSIGITTTGCCCGHNKAEGFIGVIDEDIPRMKQLGYKVHHNSCRPNDEDEFIPKGGNYIKVN